MYNIGYYEHCGAALLPSVTPDTLAQMVCLLIKAKS
jgi:hypothetical protein